MKYHIYLTLFSIIASLPFCILYGLSDALYFILYYVVHYRRKTVRANLVASFPNMTTSQIVAVEKEFYHHLCDIILETIKLLKVSEEEIDKRITMENADLIENAARDNKAIIIFIGHYCNWEWITALTRRHYALPELSCQIYKPLRDKAFDRLMLKIRSRFGSVSIPQKKTLRTLLKLKSERTSFITGFISDSRPNSKDTQDTTIFLNQPTTFSPGGEIIGNKMDATFLYLDMEKTDRGHYKFVVKSIVPSDMSVNYPYTREYFKMLQQTIERQPAYWLWSHKRWLFNRKSNNKLDT